MIDRTNKAVAFAEDSLEHDAEFNRLSAESQDKVINLVATEINRTLLHWKIWISPSERKEIEK